MNTLKKNRKSVLACRLRSVLVFAVGLFAALAAPAAHAQGCVLCYTSVAGGGDAAMRAFMWGVLSLLVPALLLFAGVFFLIYLRARAATQAQSVPAARPVRAPRMAPGLQPNPSAS